MLASFLAHLDLEILRSVAPPHHEKSRSSPDVSIDRGNNIFYFYSISFEVMNRSCQCMERKIIMYLPSVSNALFYDSVNVGLSFHIMSRRAVVRMGRSPNQM